ncbi:MAG: 30S ribosomal protein S2 [Patescibacteria group bacterium]|nr:30S ribosomal protein S2 [Patescibacteria group bacterium]
MSLPTMRELLEAGVHFGHQAKRWNPKMKPFVFTERGGVHVIDLAQTVQRLEEAHKFIKDISSKGGVVIFVGTKKQAQDIVKEEAEKVGVMYLTKRWPGGLLTNFESIKRTIKRLNDLEEKKKSGELSSFTKKEQLLIDREIAKLDELLGGVRKLTSLPDALFIVDSKKEENAVREAKKMGVPVVAIVDTNADPTKVDFPVPANDDALKSIAMLVKAISDSYYEGKAIYEKEQAKAKKEEEK